LPRKHVRYSYHLEDILSKKGLGELKLAQVSLQTHDSSSKSDKVESMGLADPCPKVSTYLLRSMER
jgi:hypothetical protein